MADNFAGMADRQNTKRDGKFGHVDVMEDL